MMYEQGQVLAITEMPHESANTQMPTTHLANPSGILYPTSPTLFWNSSTASNNGWWSNSNNRTEANDVELHRYLSVCRRLARCQHSGTFDSSSEMNVLIFARPPRRFFSFLSNFVPITLRLVAKTSLKSLQWDNCSASAQQPDLECEFFGCLQAQKGTT